MNEFENAEVVKDSKGKQYHIGLTKNDIADKIILVGDPDRAKRIAKMLDKIEVEKSNREYLTFTGKYKGFSISVMATGMGCDNTEIAVIELCQLKFPITIIRCGTCGALQKDIGIGDLVISSGALRLENTSTFFVEESYPAIANYEVVIALLKAANEKKEKYHYGITATASGFYGAQGRHVPGFPIRDEGALDRIVKQGVKNLEMETSTLLTLASLRGFRAGAVCAVFASRPKNEFIKPDKKEKAEMKAVSTTLRAFELIDKIDKQKGRSDHWLPEL